jgi:predicted metal-dependent peptidase
MQKHKLSAEQRIELVHVSLMRQKEFALFAGLFMVGTTSVVDAPITAATNGRDAKYGRAFVDILTDKELAFLIMHENMHKCYRHLTTWRALYDEDRDCANQACDFVINLQLVAMDPQEQFIAFPTDKETGKRMGLYDEQYKDMDTKQVYDLLREKQEEGGGGGGAGEPSDGKGRHGVDDSNGGFDQHDWDGATEGLSKEEKEQLERDIDQALRQGGIYAGKVGGTMSRQIGELLAPKVDWREVLRRFVKTSLKDRNSPSWRRAHRNYLWQDIIMPSIMGKRMKHLVIAMDTSGSIHGPILDAFLSEMQKILKDSSPERVDVIYWDAEVAGHEVYTGKDQASIVHRTSPKGGGGTDPDVVPAFMKKERINPDALVILSDGYMHSNPSAWAGLKCPSLWCIMGSDSYKVPHGQRVNLKEV